jgi:hypothetical protein
VSEHALAGAIPTEIGQLQLMVLDLNNNQLTGESKTRLIAICFTSKPSANKTFHQIFYRSNSNRAGALQCYENAQSPCQQIDRYVCIVLVVPRLVCESTAECFVTGIALAGAVPTEIGQLAQLKYLKLLQNQLTGACTENSLDCNGIRVHFG